MANAELKRDNCHEANIKFIEEKCFGAIQIDECFTREEIDALCIYLGIPNEKLNKFDTAQLLVEEIYKNSNKLGKLREQYVNSIKGEKFSKIIDDLKKS